MARSLSEIERGLKNVYDSEKEIKEEAKRIREYELLVEKKRDQKNLDKANERTRRDSRGM